ncbi:hypothetical protein LSUB1_G007250 [Lachnellula subtilissima]|uniref:Uncharacterized protein n=1 Tax=Lachnellula subtilissima TaxID=602034 RepID=A0A8H8U541_9HELO|nr:hypothetical protein LSUB1_G007250 [Lachnellula subtilissima]
MASATAKSSRLVYKKIAKDAFPFFGSSSRHLRYGSKCCCPKHPCRARDARDYNEQVVEARQAFLQCSSTYEDWVKTGKSRSRP